jgi:long-chain acyl-CoA synthetase
MATDADNRNADDRNADDRSADDRSAGDGDARAREAQAPGADERYAAAARQGMVLAHWAGLQPDAPAVTSAQGDRTFAQLNANANRLVRALRQRGVGAGDGLALMVSNRPEFPEVIAAAQRGGLRTTPINWHLTADEVAYIVGDCQARVFVADARFGEVAAAAATRAGGATVRLAVGGDIPGFESYDAALAPQDGGDIDDPVLGRSMLYTSGTTGRPKGVHRAETPPASAVGRLFGYRAGESRHLCTGPLYHAAPLAFSLAGPLNAGVGVVLMDRWSPEETLRLVEEERITHSHMVPTMFHRLLALPDAVREAADVSSLRMVIHGAAPCPVSVKKAMIDWWGPVLLEYYAATEGTGTFVTSADWLERPGTVGKPANPDHVRILDPVSSSDAPLPPGEVGTVYLRAPKVGRFDYFGDKAKTESTYRGEYFTLGDVGYLDEDGYLFLTDRSADLIISGGVNVYPAEVEGELLGHPAVGDAAVIGVPDPEWGESVVAVVELRDGIEPSGGLAEELIEYCRANLAGFKCPRRVDFVATLPRTDSGKLYKRRLREQYRAAAEQAGSRHAG